MFSIIVSLKEVTVCINKSICIIKEYNKAYLPITIIVAALLGTVPAISAKILQIIVNDLQSGKRHVNTYILLIVFYIGMDILVTLVNNCYGYYKAKFLLYFDKEIHTKMQVKAVEIPLKSYENSETYNTIKRAQSQNGSTLVNFIDSFISIFQSAISLITLGTILSKFHVELIIIIIFFSIIRYIYSIIIIKKKYELEIKLTKEERKLWYIDYLFMMGLAYKEIKVYGISQHLTKNYRQLNSKLIKERLSLTKESTIINSTLSILDSIASGFVFSYYIFAGLKNIILIGDVVTYTRCIFSVKSYLESMLTSFRDIAQSSLYVNFLFQFLEMASQEKESTKDLKILSQIETIELKNVSYKYGARYVLKDISIKVCKGENLAIVGMNGSGKSTLLKLILGLYKDYEGEILINGTNIKQLDMTSYYKRISCVFQDFVKYELTLQDNIGFGNIEEIENLDEIGQVLKRICLNSQIYNKNNLRTYLGNWFGDRQLSEGEWQKIAIGRMLFKKADVILLDEPDSSIDNIAEDTFIKEVTAALNGKIGFWITHKLYNLPKVADRIVVLDAGMIAECGTHEALLKNESVYAKLYNSQVK